MREDYIQEIMSNVLVLMPMLNKRFLREDELFKSENLYPSHIQILLLLSHNKQLTMSEISREIHVINSNLTPLVDKLIKLGYLKRQPSKKDRRVVHISLTASGKRQVEKHKVYVVELLKERLEQLSDEKVEQLMTHVRGLSDIISECIEP
ncbi:MAG: MarR family transcriptional regulator [Clostridiales bacterium]|nr:MarR family transcriptional regulator [Clostridiales bacterium]MDW7661035.1 MarR family transcriptional regulator [Bacillota bacterium]